MKTTPGQKRHKRSLPPTPFKAVPREEHTHGMTVVRKRRGNRVRMGCFYCPAIGPWKKSFVSRPTPGFHYSYPQETPGSASSSSAWTTDSNGFTPDEKPQSLGEKLNRPYDPRLAVHPNVIDELAKADETFSTAQMTGIINKPGIQLNALPLTKLFTYLKNGNRFHKWCDGSVIVRADENKCLKCNLTGELVHPDAEDIVLDADHPHVDIKDPVIEVEDVVDGKVEGRYTHEELDAMKVPDLRKIARELNIKRRAIMNRAELVNAIANVK